MNKCAEFSSFGETTFLWEWNSIFSKKIYRGFLNKKNFQGNSKEKWTQIKFKGKSLVFCQGGQKKFTRDFSIKKFSIGIPNKNEPWSNIMGIPLYFCQGGQKIKIKGISL